jgi:hypothetical protein
MVERAGGGIMTAVSHAYVDLNFTSLILSSLYEVVVASLLTTGKKIKNRRLGRRTLLELTTSPTPLSPFTYESNVAIEQRCV